MNFTQLRACAICVFLAAIGFGGVGMRTSFRMGNDQAKRTVWTQEHPQLLRTAGKYSIY